MPIIHNSSYKNQKELILNLISKRIFKKRIVYKWCLKKEKYVGDILWFIVSFPETNKYICCYKLIENKDNTWTYESYDEFMDIPFYSCPIDYIKKTDSKELNKLFLRTRTNKESSKNWREIMNEFYKDALEISLKK